MNINIWSDVRCPFCFIGKRKFEKALEMFPHKDEVEVTWKSFELDPKLETKIGVNQIEYLSQAKGISQNQAEEMQNKVTQIAKEVGLNFDFEKAIVANSFIAHRLIQFAKTKGLGNEIEEQLFKAHFVEGENIDDKEALIKIGVSIGLDEKETRESLTSEAFTKEVNQDKKEAQALGITGVPFFVLNNKYAVSGAQSPETFLKALNQAWEQFEQEKSSLAKFSNLNRN